ncbi:MAG: hemerythrin domain-containing protein [Gemmatimonadetes bacterium]|nr:hemerythrin domain-containing protein [Gemmatimonadota bacterium]
MSRDPFRVLEAEHQEALEALLRLEHAAQALAHQSATADDRDTVRSVLEVLTTTVKDHNEKEEEALFPLLVDDAPTMIFEDEHRRLWALETELRAALERPAPDTQIARLSLEIVELLREHIARENEVLFPVARSILGPEGISALSRRIS